MRVIKNNVRIKYNCLPYSYSVPPEEIIILFGGTLSLREKRNRCQAREKPRQALAFFKDLRQRINISSGGTLYRIHNYEKIMK